MSRDLRKVFWVAKDGCVLTAGTVRKKFWSGEKKVQEMVAANVGDAMARHMVALQEAYMNNGINTTPFEEDAGPLSHWHDPA